MFPSKTKIFLILGFFALSCFFANFALAQLGLEYATVTGLGTTNLKVLIFRLINVVLGFLGIVAMIIVLYGGFVWMTAGGNEQKISQAKKILVNGVIGLALILASWAIANFVLGQLWSATGGGGVPCSPENSTQVCSVGPCSGTQTCSGGFWGSCIKDDPTCPLGPANQLVILNYNPADTATNVIRNIVVRIKFNRNLDPTSLDYGTNFTITSPTGLVAPFAGYPKVNGSRIDFRAVGVCTPNNDCFDANTTFTVNFTAGGIKSTDGKFLTCSGPFPCTSTFTTGTIIDTQEPTVNIVVNSQFCADTTNVVEANATDDSSIAEVSFFYNGTNPIDGVADTADPIPPFDPPYLNCQGTTPDSCLAAVWWDTTGFSQGDYTLTAQATDLDSNTKTSSAKTVKLRAAHCCDTIQNFDEEAIDCGGADCAACVGSACDIDTATAGCQPDNNICASVFCDPGLCTCQQPPIIDWVNPNDGAPGNFITLGGRYFGTTAGEVKFCGSDTNTDGNACGDADDQIALFPSTVNPNCGNTWTDKQIVVVVPGGAVDGPFQVTNSANYTDQTDDARGPMLANFDVNSTVRPGLCLANPASGQFETPINLTGVRFGPAVISRTVEFGDQTNFVEADNIVFQPGDQDVSLTVPNIQAGQTSVRVKVDSEYSNYLGFTVLAGVVGGPRIDYFDPTSGPPGQYVTIFGDNFGNQVGTVKFIDGGGSETNADVNFPNQCLGNFWRNNYIIVKVPSVAFGNYNVKVVTSVGKESNLVPFPVVAGTPRPGICALDPDNGPVNTSVSFYGDNFKGAPGQVVFFNLVPATTITSWANQEVKANVPFSAVTGQVYLEDNSVPAKQSNKVPFKVGACQDDSQCDTTVPEKCCPDKSCRATCPAKIQATYGWSFTTGDYFVAQTCDKNLGIPVTGPTGQDICINAQIGVRFTTNVDDSSVVLGTTVLVEKCTGPAENPCSTTSAVNGTLSQPLVALATSPPTEGLTFTPTPFFEQGKIYLVTLRGGEGGITDEAGVPLIDDFSWTFKTRADAQQCEIGKIIIEPSQSKLVLLGATQDYGALIVSKTDPCLLLNPSGYNWVWQSSDTQVATVSGSNNNIEQAVALAPGDTIIKATIDSEKKSGTAQLTVDLSGLQVISVTPACDTACTNALIGARFSYQLNPTTLTAVNIQLYNCGADKKCSLADLQVANQVNLTNPATTYFWNGLTGDSLLGIIPLVSPLNSQTAYRVIIKGGLSGVKNYLGGPLTNLNFKSATGEECEPPNAGNCGANCLRTSGECTINTLGCNEQGLHTGSVASSCGNGVVNSPWENCDPNAAGFSAAGCDTSTCLLRGSVFPAVCGDGVLDIRYGEACDDTNQTQGDGCSAKCLNEGTSLPICGNSVVDFSEDCDDGNTTTGDGCSAKCLAEGTVGSVCGDGKIGVGEDCDEGNIMSGDGCSSICLNEGPTGLAVCGNGILEDGQTTDSYSWVFGTGSDVCQPEKVEVLPKNLTATIGQKINYQTNLYSAPDTCSDKGQALDANRYLWTWTSSSGVVADFNPPADSQPTQVVEAKAIGTAQICSQTDLGGGNIKSDCTDLTVARTAGPGTSCQQSGNGCCDVGVSQCSAGYNCIWDIGQPDCPLAGVAPAPAVTKPGCRCCCDPTNDLCSTVSPNLYCDDDKSPCTGGNRGLCCGCKSDADCADPVNIGCGKDTCCRARPLVISTTPADTQSGVCRNVKIKVDFDQPMQTNSFVGKVELKKMSDGSFVKGTTSYAGNNVLYFTPEKPLEANTQYEVTVKKEVLSQYQVKMAADYIFTFTTGGLVCEDDYLKISITRDAEPAVVTNKDFFNCVRDDCSDDIDGATVGNQHSYLAEAMDRSGVPLTGYDYSWQDTDPDDIVIHNVTNQQAIVITANNKNGQAIYNVKATPQSTSGLSGTVANKVNITNFICENPWPSVATWPWLDDLAANPQSSCNYDTDPGIPGIQCTNWDTYFQLLYCRDAGAEGTADDLPPLSNPPIIRGQSGSILKEFFFPILSELAQWDAEGPNELVRLPADEIITEGINKVYSVIGDRGIFSSDFMPVNTNLRYVISGRFKSASATLSRLYFGFAPYDENKEFISDWDVLRTGNEVTITSITDTQITVAETIIGWNGATTRADTRALGFYYNGVTNNKTPDDVYYYYSDPVSTDPAQGAYDGTVINGTNIIPLNNPAPASITSQIIPGTTKVMNHYSGGSYLYAAAADVLVPTSWTEYRGDIFGEAFGNSANTFRLGTKYVKIIILANYRQTSAEKLLFDDIKFYAQ